MKLSFLMPLLDYSLIRADLTVISRDVEARSGQGVQAALVARTSEAADPSEAPPHRGGASVPEKHRQNSPQTY